MNTHDKPIKKHTAKNIFNNIIYPHLLTRLARANIGVC